MTVIGQIRDMLYRPTVNTRRQFYAFVTDREDTLSIQLHRWNQEWQRIIEHVPYYRRLQQEQRLPRTFSSWEEFLARLPVTKRDSVRFELSERTSDGHPANFLRITGGSTAEPIQMPAWHSETAHTLYDTWVGRSWYDIHPSSRMFALWGHSHLLGPGLKGQLNAWKRICKDYVLGYYRFSAYDMRPEVLRQSAQEVLRFRPDYLLGYSHALDLFARINADQQTQLSTLGLRMVVGAAEAFPAPDSEEILSTLFNCPVAMEYGSVETGLIAHTTPQGGYRTFWQTYFIEAIRTNPTEERYSIRVTSLYPRCFPLVRYELGDEVELKQQNPSLAYGLTTIARIIGRSNDHIILYDGTVLHSEVFTHAVRACAGILSFQIIKEGSAIRLYYTAAQELKANDLHEIRQRFSKVHPLLAEIPIEHVEQLEQTRAGKIRMILIRSEQKC